MRHPLFVCPLRLGRASASAAAASPSHPLLLLLPPVALTAATRVLEATGVRSFVEECRAVAAHARAAGAAPATARRTGSSGPPSTAVDDLSHILQSDQYRALLRRAVDFEATAAVQALGALARCLVQSRSLTIVTSGPTAIPFVNGIDQYDPKAFVMVDEVRGWQMGRGWSFTQALAPLTHPTNSTHAQLSLRALQVFDQESHPSLVRGPGRAKEGFSIFAQLDVTSSSVGRNALRSWLRKPLRSRDRLEERLDAIQIFIELGGSEPEQVRALKSSLKKLYAVGQLIHRFKTATGKVQDWKLLFRSLEAMEGCIVCLQELAVSASGAFSASSEHLPPLLQDLLGRDLGVVSSLLRTLTEVVDWDAITTVAPTNRVLPIAPGVNPALDKKRKLFARLEQHLASSAFDDVLRLFGEDVDLDLVYTYIPQVGYVAQLPRDLLHVSDVDGAAYICVPSPGEARTHGGEGAHLGRLVRLPDSWTFEFESEGVCHFKNDKTATFDKVSARCVRLVANLT